MVRLTTDYNNSVQEELKYSSEKLEIMNVGKIDPKRHLESDVESLMSSNVVQTLGAMVNTLLFEKQDKN
jgi:26S proteasome regulatory subunit N11